MMFSSIALFTSTAALACGAASDCKIDDRTYRIKMPEGHDGSSKVGAIIFNHGYRGTGAGLMRNKRLSKTISDMGLAFIAPKSARADWDIPNAPSDGPRVELAFFDKLKSDVVKNHHVDPAKVVVTGFSAGGMMTWNLACDRGDQYAGFIPMSGTFWAPIPKSCATLPANIIHIHGATDRVVPISGRAIGNTRQGNVEVALKLAVSNGGFGPLKAVGEFDGISCQRSEGKSGKFVEFCLHKGGHTFKSSWLARAWKELERAGAFGS